MYMPAIFDVTGNFEKEFDFWGELNKACPYE